MLFTVSRRKVATLAVAGSGLGVMVSGAVAPAAIAAPLAPAVASATAGVAAADSGWFVDPRTVAQRRAQVVVPAKPRAYRGKVVETRAVYRTRAGDLAVPMSHAFGHQVEQGQALTISHNEMFKRSRISRLASALENASSIRCEGYTDYKGKPARKRALARKHAARVCAYLAAANEELKTKAVGYGSMRPVVIGGTFKERRLNRRVIVKMTGTKPAIVREQPSAPTGLTASGDDGVLSVTFAPPESDGGSSVTGYLISYDGGNTWTQPALSGEAPWTVEAAGFTNGTTYDVRVRAENAWGAGPAAAAQVLVASVPGAPALDEPSVDGTTAALSFSAPSADGGTEVTGYELSLDGGATWGPFSYTSSGAKFHAELRDLTYGKKYLVRIRAFNARGAGQESDQRTLAPVTVPDAPTSVVASVDGTTVKVSFHGPHFHGGTAITGYEVKVDDGNWVAAALDGWGSITLTGQSYGSHIYTVRALNAVGHSAGAASQVVEVVEPRPSAYRAEYYELNGVVYTNLFFWKVDGAQSYEAKLDDGDWLPVTIPNDSYPTSAYGTVDDPVCNAEGASCSGDRTVVMRAVTADGAGQPGKPFTVTWFVL